MFVKDDEGQRHGIVCFRWLIENDEPVLYLYEIQLEDAACRRGIGHGFKSFMIGKYFTISDLSWES